MAESKPTDIKWRCYHCHSDSIHGGVKQTSKTNGVAGRCYFCDKPVPVYLGSKRSDRRPVKL